MKDLSYALLTAVRNEQAHIVRVLDCICRQTSPPKVWLIIDTGSSDGTDEIIKEHVRTSPFILFKRVRGGPHRNFAAKVRALRYGHDLLRRLNLEYLGILDADVSFGPEYYEEIIARFTHSPELGIAGGVCIDVTDVGRRKLHDDGHVRGAIQMFRSQCLEDIGGFLPLVNGGEDAVAEIMARMRGWVVRSYPELRVLHHRRTGTGESTLWKARFRQGACDYNLGYHPLFELAKCVRRLGEKPYFLGSLFRLSGYGWSAMRVTKRPVPPDVVHYLRKEQAHRLWGSLIA
jgi:glycosyltransferase involved in cell wall biosynthesis